MRERGDYRHRHVTARLNRNSTMSIAEYIDIATANRRGHTAHPNSLYDDEPLHQAFIFHYSASGQFQPKESRRLPAGSFLLSLDHCAIYASVAVEIRAIEARAPGTYVHKK